MLFSPSPLGKKELDKSTLADDRKNCRKFGPCGVGKQALYLGGRFISRSYYLPWREVKRVFKRVAMSPGGFSGRGVFGTLPFLVVQFGSGQEKECPFKIESDVDNLLAYVEQEMPGIPTHSVKAENKLARDAAAEEARYLKELSPEAAGAVAQLEGDVSFLDLHPSLCNSLTSSARQKRIADNLRPAYRIVGAAAGILGLLAAAYGIYGLFVHLSYAMYCILGGGAIFFMALSSNTFPSKWNSRKHAQEDWDRSVERMRSYLKGRPSFSVPPQYAHPTVLARMIRILKEGRAQTAGAALSLLKEDLKALNSSVKVSQKEHDEVVAIKPLFLVSDYQDEL